MVLEVTKKEGGVVLVLAALVFLGTWPAIFNLCERRGRLPIHTFLDYSITNFLTAVVIALTLGQIGSSTPEKPNFTAQLSQDNAPSVGFALAGGVFLCAGNLATQYSLAFVGLSVTEVVASSITVVGGTTINYFLDGRINRAEILFPGVCCFLMAAIAGMFVHHSNKGDMDRKMGIVRKGNALDRSRDRRSEVGMSMSPPLGVELPNEDKAFEDKYAAMEAARSKLDDDEAHTQVPQLGASAITGGGGAKSGTADYLANVEAQRSIKNTKYGPLVGLSITVTAGLSYVIFSPAFNLSVNDQWNKLSPGVPHLVVYTAFFWFSLSFFACAFILNIFWLYKPPLGLPKSSIGAWVKDWTINRFWALLAGIICGLGNGMQFMGGQAAGYAAADAVQALPLVSTFWGILLFGEYHRSSRKTYTLLVVMLLLFAAAVGLLMGSAGTRKN